MYESLDMVCYFRIHIRSERLTIPVLKTHLQEFRVKELKEMAVEYVNIICRSRDPLVRVDDIDLQSGNTSLADEALLEQIEDRALYMLLHAPSQIKLDELAQHVHDNTKDID